MAVPVIGLTTMMRLEFSMDERNRKKFSELLDANKLQHSISWPYPMIAKFCVHVNIRQAELTRQLLKNITVYD